MNKFPRITIAGLGGDNGKTLISLGIITNLRKTGVKVHAFKKGPDFIDASWLSYAAGCTARNLDVFLMGKDLTKQTFIHHAVNDGVNIIEGNRGLFDGMNADGDFSTAELAKIVDSPVILVVDATKVTRTIAALILGIQNFDKNLNIAAVIVNRIKGARHQRIVRESIEKYTGLPIIGMLPELEYKHILPSRHLGLVTPAENNQGVRMLEMLGEDIARYINVEAVISIAKGAPRLIRESNEEIRCTHTKHVKIGYFFDSAFTFYYPDNLEALVESGAELVPISPLHDSELPDIDLLYIGGGFPETHLANLSGNVSMLKSVCEAGQNGLPIYAECGGLVWLSRSMTYHNETFKLCNLLPLNITFKEKPAGHGYCKVIVDNPNPFFPVGTKFKGHEFHYTEAFPVTNQIESVFNTEKGVGALKGRDGIVFKNIFASYFHFHAIGNSEWAKGLINAAKSVHDEMRYMNYGI